MFIPVLNHRPVCWLKHTHTHTEKETDGVMCGICVLYDGNDKMTNWVSESYECPQSFSLSLQFLQVAFRGHAFTFWEQMTLTYANITFTHQIMWKLSFWMTQISHLTPLWCPGGPVIMVKHFKVVKAGVVVERWPFIVFVCFLQGSPSFEASRFPCSVWGGRGWPASSSSSTGISPSKLHTLTR